MKKGIVMEVNKRFLTILTPEGEFLRTKNQNNVYQIGQEIDFIPFGQEERGNPFNLFLNKRMVFSTAIAAVILFSFFYIPYYQSNQVYAYMSIDVNPSIELAVNKDFEVLDIVPYNEDGKNIVEQLSDWTKKDLQDVTDAILTEIRKQGYMEEQNHEVVISTVDLKGDKEDREKQWSKEINEIRNVIEKETVELMVIEGTKEDREKAKEKGLTTGLYKENQKQPKKEKNNLESSEGNSTKQVIPPASEPPSDDKQWNVEKGKSEEAPGQQKKHEINSITESQPGKTVPNNSSNMENEAKVEQSQNYSENNKNNNDQKDKNINPNKNKNENNNKQNQEKQDKHNKE